MYPKIFKDKTVVCVASGPSLTQEQCDMIEYSGLPTIAVNNSFKMTHFCDIVFAADLLWWRHYYNDVIDNCPQAQLWTLDSVLRPFYQKMKDHVYKDLNGVAFERGKGLGKDCVNHGGNSGYIAVNLAYLFGAKKIVLVGYDHQHTFGQKHFFGDHDMTVFRKNAEDTDRWLRNFDDLAKDLESEGVDVVNCTVHSAITLCRRNLLMRELK